MYFTYKAKAVANARERERKKTILHVLVLYGCREHTRESRFVINVKCHLLNELKFRPSAPNRKDFFYHFLRKKISLV